MSIYLLKTRIAFSAFMIILAFQLLSVSPGIFNWESSFLKVNKNESIRYIADEKGNTIPDFSRVGYYGGNQHTRVDANKKATQN